MVEKDFFGEDKSIEFKREIPGNHEKFLKDIIAFSNTSGGKVIIGIEDKTNIVYGIGDQNPFKLSDSISNMISDACTPQIDPDITMRTLEDKTILEIDVVPGKFRPYYIANKGKETTSYIRINGTSRPADARRLKELEMKRIALEACKSEDEKAEVKDMTLEKLEDFGVLSKSGKKFSVTNAVVHRSYLDEACVQACIFDDRIEVLSPGMLYGGLDITTAKMGKSRCRNEAIAEAFHYMHIIESWGTGIPRLFSRSAEYGLPEPLFEEFGDGIKVTMFRKVSSSAQKVSSSDEKVSSSAQKVSSADEKVGSTFDKYVSVLKNAGITDKFIESIEMVFNICDTGATFGQVNVQEWLKCSKSKSTNVMKAMKTAKIIKKVSGAGFGRYQFIEL